MCNGTQVGELVIGLDLETSGGCVITWKVSPGLHQPSCGVYLWGVDRVYVDVIVTD